jgi:hypothetical protein|tara:strand:+ start:6480 stop:6992 length:513 start_codon:yes stop_codon:yes gene_type:complete
MRRSIRAQILKRREDYSPRMAEEIRERSYGFKAVKTALRQTKDGINITLVIHPNDTPRDLINDHIGQRYTVGMGRLNEQDEIEEPESMREGKRAVTSCAALCRDTDFQRWLYDNGFTQLITEEETAEAIRLMLSVESRSELKTNEEAQERWEKIKKLFISRRIFKESDFA